MNPTSRQSAKTPLVAAIACWVVSCAAFIVGIILFLKGRSLSVSAQVGATDGTISDAHEFYQKSTDGTALTSLGTALIAVSILAVVVTLAAYVRPRLAAPAASFGGGYPAPYAVPGDEWVQSYERNDDAVAQEYVDESGVLATPPSEETAPVDENVAPTEIPSSEEDTAASDGVSVDDVVADTSVPDGSQEEEPDSENPDPAR